MIKTGTLLLPILTFAGAIAFGPSDSAKKETFVIISGGAMGHLSPCGCTKPMSGGLSRLATVVRQYKSQGNAIWIDSGRVVETGSRQSQLKFETYLESLGELKADAFFLSRSDEVLGEEGLVSGSQLANTKWIGKTKKSPGVTTDLRFGNLRISTKDPQADIVLQDLKSASGHSNKGVTVFFSEGSASVSGRMVSPGSHLRGYVLAVFQNQKLKSIRAVPLIASIPEDKKVEKIYRNYLQRVRSEGLIHKMNRFESEEYVGSEKCVSCHQKESEIHFKSLHAKAFQTLEKDGHDADPDCVSCHVVGADSVLGFRFGDRKFSEVGCESCHGAGGDHVANPKAVKFSKFDEKTCTKCHTPTTSPGFNFLTFWARIKH